MQSARLRDLRNRATLNEKLDNVAQALEAEEEEEEEEEDLDDGVEDDDSNGD